VQQLINGCNAITTIRIISGETQASYTVTANGDYAVILTNGNCIDTSRCVTVIVTGLENHSGESKLSVWPVPASNTLTIGGLNGLNRNIEIYDETGRLVMQKAINGSNDLITIDIDALESGIYYLRDASPSSIKSGSKFSVIK
jgi:hypothetical protein